MEERRKFGKREFLKRCAAFSAGIIFFPYESRENGLFPGDQKSGLHLAMFQEETPRGIMCRICPNECELKEGELSKCNNRKVINSKLYTMAYGNPCSVNVDPVEKKPLYHFFPGTRAFSIATAGCNLACLNCQNWSISQTSPDKTRNISLPPEKVVEEALKLNCKSIAYTYSEPVSFYEYSYDTANIAKEAGVKNIFKSNGYINREPLEKLCKVLDAANIDLKSFNESTYVRLSGGKLQPVLDALKIFRDNGVWLEITNLIVPKWTDKPDEIRNMCRWLFKNGFEKTPLHFSRFYPTYKLEQLPPTPLNILNEAARIAAEEGLKFVYIGNVPGNEMADTRCPSCKNVIIKRTGYRIDFNKIKAGKCEICGSVINGVWN